MFKRLSLSLLLLSVTSTSLFAADVYIIKRAKFYHLATCPKLDNKQKSALDEKQAEARGLRPCPICFRDKK